MVGLVSLCFFTLSAQVGINTTTPKAQLDISIANPAAPENTDGILIPRISRFPAPPPTADQNGMLVFLSVQTGNFEPGFYYWKNSSASWESLGGKTGSDFNKVGTTLPATSQQDAIFRRGNVNIGGESDNVKLKVVISPTEPINTKTGIEIENASAAPTTVTYGIVSNNKSITADKKYGFKNTVSADGTGIHYGIFNEVSQNTNEEIYGIYNNVGKTFGATKNHYGIYSEIGTIQGNGTVYGIYSTAIGNDPKKVFAGYFAGRLGIGNSPAEEYILPATRGSQDQILVTDGNGILSWRHPVFKTYNSTTSATGTYIITDDTYTLRINNQVSSITIPDAATNKGRILILLNWSGNAYKPFTFLNGNDLFDITTNATVAGISGGQKMIIQSAGNRWVVLDK
jgi:hypothetical protein